MIVLARILLPFIAILCLAPLAQAQGFALVDPARITVCPGDGTSLQPDFSAPDCRETSFWEVDPQNREIWIRGQIQLSRSHLDFERPLGLFFYGMAASEVWLNDQYLGANGRPGSSADAETAGRMDSVFYVPRSHLREGDNQIVLRLSAWRGSLILRNPLHVLGIGPYADPARVTLRSYAPALINLGAFFLGFIFFGISAIRGEDRGGSTLLSLLSLTAALQLLVEAGRGIIAYAYPMHEIRLFLIVLASTLFGLLLVAYLIQRFSDLSPAQQILRLAGVLVLQTGVIMASGGYDQKAGYAFLAASLCGIGWTTLWAVQKKAGALTFLAILSGFSLLLLLFAGQFLDTYFFFAVTGLLLFLFWQQALALVRARREKQVEANRASQLEVALAQARQKSAPDQIQLVSAGRVDYVATDTITQLKGAGDYVEVYFQSGQSKLYNGGLTQLESELPPTFLRVHRSHIVNTAFVSALERDVSGVGKLVLSNGAEAPVSRRIMPKVRNALEQA